MVHSLLIYSFKAMQPLIAPQRCYIPGGLWTPKLGGKVTEGDSKRTSHVIEGKVKLPLLLTLILIQSVTTITNMEHEHQFDLRTY